MLQFFRKYQRFFFVIVTVVIVVSFSFFGTFTSIDQEGRLPDRMLLKAVDGSPMMEKELSAMCQLISTSAWNPKGPSLLSDQMVEKEVLGTGIGLLMARQYFEELKPDLEERLKAIKEYRPYVHPQNSEISAEKVWSRWAPHLNRNLSQLKMKSDQVTVETLAILFQLYLDQASLPPHFLKQILLYELSQQELPADPLLQQGDLSLFGFHSLDDWFGPKFVSLLGQYMINAAFLAKDRGYCVPMESVRKDLYRQLAVGYREMTKQKNPEVTELENYYRSVVQSMGGDERLLLKTWQSLMLFKQLFQSVGDQMALDDLPFRHFQAYSKQALVLEYYELPPFLKCRSLDDVFEWQVYLEAISESHAQRKELLGLPLTMASIDAIQKRAPELIDQQIDIQYAEVNRQDLIRQISLKQTWDWEMQEEGWALISKQFPELESTQVLTSADRLRALERLHGAIRLKVDAFAREQMVVHTPERIQEALNQAPVQTISIGMRVDGLSIFKSASPYRLLDALRSASLQVPMEYSDDGKHHYRITVANRSPERQVLSFEQAKKEGVLTRMLEKRLESAYPDVRRRQPSLFAKSQEKWQPTPEMKMKVGRYLFKDLLKAIEASCQVAGIALPSAREEVTDDFYVRHRFVSVIYSMKERLEQDKEGACRQMTSLPIPWICRVERVERNNPQPFAKSEMFAVPLKGWSSIVNTEPGKPAFYQVVGQEEPVTGLMKEKEQGDYLLGLDAKRRFAAELLNQIKTKQAIDLETKS